MKYKRIIILLLTLFIICFVQFNNYSSYDEMTTPHKPMEISPSMYIDLTADEREFIHSLGVIQVVVDESFPPISYYDANKKEFVGISIEVLGILSKTIGFEYTIIQDETLSWADRLNLIRDNKALILCGASISDERKKYGYFTDTPYFEMNYALIGSINHHVRITDINDISKYKIGLIEGTSINEYILKFAYPQNIIYYKTFDDAFAALKKQEINLIPDNEASFIEKYFKGKLFDYEIVFSINGNVRKYAFFSPKTEEGKKLTTILTKGMKRIPLKKVANTYYEDKSIFAYYKDHVQQEQRISEIRNFFLLLLIGIFIIFINVTALMRKRNKELEFLSSTDYLTGLKNRTALFNDFSDLSKLTKAIVCYIDLDNFKIINDTFGHETGDMVLQSTAHRLKEFLPDANIYRMGGDEFLIIITSAAIFDGKSLLAHIENPIHDKQNIYQVSASIGYIDTSECKYSSLNEIINAADTAMLKAKTLGKNNIVKAPNLLP
ncbi:diguanylate cyclase (GGDEF) domain-containing protein [Pelosinus propionicus DSM 13327]|uniref:Diguanylate cyclase (GGDEF) domain-containing protein n=2 Tax=Pelosinus TaxID=365348 RepID=A0A1I4MDK8_9FIRM|nr:diguanylate cyclase (GGDEF) domain-containing protein [Pelosinus propionicus DSM 13327]